MLKGRQKSRYAAVAAVIVGVTAFSAPHLVRARTSEAGGPSTESAAVADPLVLRGRFLVISHGCGGCHGPSEDGVSEPGWLAGEMSPAQQFLIGPCAVTPGATP